jgi:hypothetical protein
MICDEEQSLWFAILDVHKNVVKAIKPSQDYSNLDIRSGDSDESHGHLKGIVRGAVFI